MIKNKKLRSIITGSILIYVALFGFGYPLTGADTPLTGVDSVLAAPAPQSKSQETVCKELSKLDPDACKDDSSSILQGIVTPVIEVLIFVIGAVSVVVIIISGFLYIISTGEPNNTKRAKDALLYAVIGLVVALFAQAIVTFVIQGLA